MASVTYPHIEPRADGVPMISGTRMKVAHIAIEKVAWLWDADQIQRQHPELTLGQIHSALAYYFDHRDEIDRYIEESERYAEEMRAKPGASPSRAELIARSSIP